MQDFEGFFVIYYPGIVHCRTGQSAVVYSSDGIRERLTSRLPSIPGDISAENASFLFEESRFILQKIFVFISKSHPGLSVRELLDAP
jgi:hypothetical protein